MFGRQPKVKAYWWKEISNFGDALAPFLLARFSGLTRVEWNTISRASVASIGSILEHIPPMWDGYVLGSGKLFEDSRLHLHTNTAKILAIRGPLSARSVRGTFALGDPGILVDQLIDYHPNEKSWDLGIVPHWQDSELVEKFLKLIPSQYTCKVISSHDDPIRVLQQISACKRIVTSSMHGMIAADSFGIPRRVEICKAMERDGGLFKFHDYSESIHTPLEVGKMTTPSRFRIEDVQFSILDAYDELGKAIRK
jgi:pyruvyltransferase